MDKLKLNTKRFWLVALLAGLLLSVGAIRSAGWKALLRHPTNSRPDNRLAALPHIILWAWERPEKLDFINPGKVGVAFLAKSLYLRSEKVVARPRLQQLDVPAGTPLVAVARIESDRSESPSLSNDQMKRAVSELTELARLPGVVAVQVDFDATLSERAFYRDLLNNLRNQLPASTGLSITALASWCKGDNWLANLPVDEAIPMLFRMGADRPNILSSIASGEDFSSRPCQQSSGISTDEPLSRLPASQRIYVFNPNPWSLNAVQKIMERYQR